MEERIQKVLSAQGYCSRRAAEQLIEQGRVKVNGHIAHIGDKIDPAKDVLSVDGSRVYFEKKVKKVYYALNKPRGYVTTMSDSHAGRIVTELLGDIDIRVYPVGRLDKDSEGLLLFTNDGDFANLITHPSGNINKLYRVTLSPAPTEEQLIAMATGVDTPEGETLYASSARLLNDDPARGVVELVLTEGKNREIRRMCEALGLEVKRLKRQSIGPIRLGMLATGKYRELTKEEINGIKNLARREK